jgi:DnaJ-class molecular chaperone
MVDPAELALLAKLRAELQGLSEKTAWELLGISQGADAAQCKAAFHQASKRYHPHLFARYADPEIKQVVTELFIAHKRAYTTLIKSGKGTRAQRPA